MAIDMGYSEGDVEVSGDDDDGNAASDPLAASLDFEDLFGDGSDQTCYSSECG